MENEDPMGMYEFGLLHGIDLNKQPKTILKVNDIVKLKDDTLTKGFGINKDQFKKIYDNNFTGKIVRLWEEKSHYLWGEYASIEWSNGDTTDLIHVSYLSGQD